MLALVLAGCMHVAPLRVYPNDVQPGALRLVQVMMVGTRADIVGAKEWHEALLASGIRDDAITDGSMAVGRVFCCGGTAERPTRQAFYIPPGTSVAPGDVVELRAGREPAPGTSAQVNVATRVVQKDGERGACRWEPQDPKLWMRVLYCDWMPAEGWVELKTTLQHTWMKPPAAAPAASPR
jgi:hypothetical protein